MRFGKPCLLYGRKKRLCLLSCLTTCMIFFTSSSVGVKRKCCAQERLLSEVLAFDFANRRCRLERQVSSVEKAASDRTCRGYVDECKEIHQAWGIGVQSDQEKHKIKMGRRRFEDFRESREARRRLVEG